MIAHALDHGTRPGVAHRETLAGASGDEDVAAGRAVEHGVAHQHGLVREETGVVRRADRDLAPVDALAHVVVRLAHQVQAHAAHKPRAKRLPGRALEVEVDRAFRQPLVAVLFRDAAGDTTAHGAIDVPDRVGAADRRALLDRLLDVQEDAVVQRLAGAVVAVLHGAVRLAAFRVHRRDQLRKVDVARAAPVLRRQLRQQVGAPDDVVQPLVAEPGKDFAHVLCHVAHEVDEHLRRADVLLAQVLALRRHPHRAGVEVALARHLAAHGDHRRGAKAVLISAEQGGDDHIAAGVEAAVDAQRHAPAQAVHHQHLLRLRHAQLPRRARVLDRRPRRGAGAAIGAADLNHVGVRLHHAGRDRADALGSDELHAHPRVGVGHLQVVDELGDVLDRVDVVMRRWRDQRGPRHHVPQRCDVRRDLFPRQLAAFAGLGALRHLDLELRGARQVGGRHAEPAGGHLLHRRVRIALVTVWRVPSRVLPALAGVGPRPEPVHRARDILVRLRAERAQRHRARLETLRDALERLHSIDVDRVAVGGERQQVAQRRRRATLHQFGVRPVLLTAPALRHFVQGTPDLGLVRVVVAGAGVLVPAAAGDLPVAVGVRVPLEHVPRDVLEADAANARGGAGEGMLDHLVADAKRLEDLGAVVGGDR